MRKDEAPSIFSEFFKPGEFADRYAVDRARAIDVIIPIIHTNEFWRANLISIYREIPVNRLLLGDGGCIDDSLEIAAEFPRVEVLDHRHFTSLGYSIRHLVEATETEWFVYLHSDVYLPPGWFDAMSAHRGEYDWFECNQRITVIADYLFDSTRVRRSYSGSQMGRKAAFANVTPQVDDDYLYRNEDIIFQALVERAGFRYGKVPETFHYHQVMYKPSRWHRAIKRVDVEVDLARDEDIRANKTYAQGIIKYLAPSDTSPDIVDSVRIAASRLVELGDMTERELVDWARKNNPQWVSLLIRARSAARYNRRAEKIKMFAELYRVHGGWRSVGIVMRSRVRRALMTVQGLWVGAKGGARKAVKVYREDGWSGVSALVKGRLGRGQT
jgi:hypothetical protein